ncbi:MAG TPA: Rieske 2Fe-2S domain-containing protein [Segetibacter sp.]
MEEKKVKWHKIADNIDIIDWQNNNLALIDVAGKKITLARNNNAVNACAHKCPHASGIMADGFIDALGNIVCPLHRYKFNLSNGRNASGEGYYLKVYPVENRETGIFIGIEENNWLNIFR